MLAIPLDKLIALLDELEKNVVGAQLRWRQLRRLIDQEAAQPSVEPTASRIKAGDDFSYMLSQQIKKD